MTGRTARSAGDLRVPAGKYRGQTAGHLAISHPARRDPSGRRCRGRALIYLGERVDQFVAEFARFGLVVHGPVGGRIDRQGAPYGPRTPSPAGRCQVPSMPRWPSWARGPFGILRVDPRRTGALAFLFRE